MADCDLTSSTEFAKPDRKSGRFENPKSFNNWLGVPGGWSILKWRVFEKDNENVPGDPTLDRTIPVHNLTKFESQSGSKLFASWLGHATVLVQMEDIRVNPAIRWFVPLGMQEWMKSIKNIVVNEAILHILF
uniref:Tafazzin family protein n=1 Tax=Heterorhabditis bacteriophora TaxID=37862 RepID=A0A1I7WZ58_HETBA